MIATLALPVAGALIPWALLMRVMRNRSLKADWCVHLIAASRQARELQRIFVNIGKTASASTKDIQRLGDFISSMGRDV